MLNEIYAIWKFIDDNINDYSDNVFSEIYQHINNVGVREYFFDKIIKSDEYERWLKQLIRESLFSPEKIYSKKNRRFRWSVLRFIQELSNSNKLNHKTASDIAIIIEDIIDYQLSHKTNLDDGFNTFLVETIFELPHVKIKDKYFRYLSEILGKEQVFIDNYIPDTLIPKFIQDRNESSLARILDIAFEYEIDDSKYPKLDSKIESYYLEQLVEKHTKEIVDTLSVKSFDIVFEKVDEISQNHKYFFNNISIRSVAHIGESNNIHEYETICVKYLRDSLIALDEEKKVEYLEKLLLKNNIARRISIHIINNNFYKYFPIFYEWMKESNPFSNLELEQELSELINDNIQLFPAKKVSSLIDKIDSINFEGIPEFNLPADQRTNNIKKIWLELLAEHNISNATNLLKQIYADFPEKINRKAGDNRDYGTSLERSSVSSKELSELTPDELGSKLDHMDFQSNHELRSFSDALSIVFKEDPNKHIHSLQKFLDKEIIIQNGILRGYLQAWQDGTQFNWNKVFQFIHEIISQKINFDNTGLQQNNSNFDTNNWIISTIAELITEGTRKDEKAFDKVLLPDAESIILELSKKTKSNYQKLNNTVDDVFGITRSKIYTALINLSLRQARLSGSEEEKWNPEIKAHWSRNSIENPESTPEIWFANGRYLSNLSYLDDEWVKMNFDKLLPKEDKFKWQFAMGGYLFFSKRIYKNLYYLMRSAGNYTKAINTNFTRDGITDSLANHIGVGYLNQWENLNDDDSVVNQLIDSDNIGLLKSFVEYFWRIKDRIKDETDLLKPLWKKIYSKIIKDANKFGEIHKSLLRWVTIFAEIDDEIKEWTIGSIKSTSNDQIFFYRFMENLHEHSKVHPILVAEIIKTMIDKNIFIDHKKEIVHETVKNIYSADVGLANQIAIQYANEGYRFLKDLYYDNN